MWTLAAFAALAGTGAPVSVSTAPISAAEINELATKVRRFAPEDEFDTPPEQASVDGRRFIVDVAAVGAAGCTGQPMWDYTASERKLYVSARGGRLDLNTFFTEQGRVNTKPRDIWGDPIRYFSTGCERGSLPSYRATNAYGAVFTIEPTMQTVTAIADSLPSNLDWPPTFTTEISGREARSLVEHLVVRLTGTLTDWKPGVAVACGSKREGPTADSPYDRRLNICLFHGRVESFEVIDARDERVLFSATRPN